MLPGYTCAKLVKAGAELVGVAVAGAKVGLRGIEGNHTNPMSFSGNPPQHTHTQKLSLEFIKLPILGI